MSLRIEAKFLAKLLLSNKDEEDIFSLNDFRNLDKLKILSFDPKFIALFK